MKRLEGKVAIITGAARGQGAREAALFVAEGARVALTDILESGAETAAALGDSAIYIRHDVGDEEHWRKVIDRVDARFGRISILVNNAGIFRPSSLSETSLEDFDLHYRVNQRGVFLGMKSVLASMKTFGGSIINVSSLAGLRGYPDMVAYCSTKWAIRGMSNSAARELAPFGIRVNSIYPGLVDTPMLKTGLSPEALAQFASSVPLGRLASAADVAELVVFLASDSSSYITGGEITVDGGLVL